MTRDYVLDQGFADERKRIAGMEALWDPGSRRCSTNSASATGWKMPRGRRGRRVAGRVDGGARRSRDGDRHRHPVHRASGLRMRSTCAASTSARTSLPQAEFDLVHARLVLEHLTDRTADPRAVGIAPCALAAGSSSRTTTGLASVSGARIPVLDNSGPRRFSNFMEQAGFERDYGRRVVEELDRRRPSPISAGRAVPGSIDSSSPGFDFFRLSFESLRGALVDAGMLSAEEADAASARFGETDARLHADDDGRNRPPRLIRQRNPLRRRNTAVTAARPS